MHVVAICLLVLSILHLLVANYLLQQYRKSIFHRYWIFIFLLLGLFYASVSLFSLIQTGNEIWMWVRILAFTHFISPLLIDSILYLLRKKLRLNSWIKNGLLYIPFILVFLVDFIAPHKTILGARLTEYGYVYVLQDSGAPVVYKAIVYALAVVFLILISILGYFKEKDLLKKRFYFFLFVSIVLPLSLYVFYSYWVEDSVVYLIPMLTTLAFITLIMFIAFLNRFNLFDISLEIAWNDIISNMPNMVFLLDRDFRILEINSSVCNQLSYCHNELKNVAFHSLIHLQKDNAIEKNILSTSGSEVLIKSKEEKYITAIIFISEVYRKGVFLGYMIIGNDTSKLNKLSDEKRMLQLELNALQVQMNPHFIFNSVHSIQHLISKNQEIPANEYLADLAHLMRSVMESVGSDFIHIEAEIRILQMYLNLESLRFEKNFTYKISQTGHVGNGLDKIPPMMIQPFIENAILQGLLPMPSEAQKKLFVCFESKNDCLNIVIQDNGVGWGSQFEPESLLQHQPKSSSFENIMERIRLYNSYSDIQEIKIEISDIRESGEQYPGTNVLLSFRIKGAKNEV